MTNDRQFVCNPVNYKELREIVNNDLLLRNSASIHTDSFIPRGMVFDVSSDSMFELTEFVAKVTALL